MTNKTFSPGHVLMGVTPIATFFCILKEIRNDRAYYFASFYPKGNVFFTHSWVHSSYLQRHATEQEKQTLLEAINQNGYQWNPSAKELSLRNNIATIPGTINIAKLSMELKNKSFGDSLAIGNSDLTKLLLVRNEGYEVVLNNQYLFVKANCLLISCQYNELKHGDTAYMGGAFTDPYDLKFYAKILEEGYVYLHNNTAVRGSRTDYEWYKIIPV